MKRLRGLLCVLLALCLLPVQAGAAPAAWAEEDVERADRLGLIPAECSFNYQRDVTREQIAAILCRAEVTGEQLDELIAAYNRACLTSSRYDPDPGDTVRSFSRWITLHMADGSEFPLCHRGKGEVRVWGEGEGNMILRSLELYELLEEIVCPPDDPAGS